jgi:sulfatase maturation enzyme AslB (radical SAM superfamily)
MNCKPFCLFPWFHQKVNPDGSVQPCCVWAGEKPDSSLTPQTYFDSDFNRTLRQKFLANDIPENCSKCVYHSSINDHQSLNRWSHQLAEQFKVDVDNPILMSQEVDISNLCNLKCRMCHQIHSTSWIADNVAMGQASLGLLQSGWNLTDSQARDARLLSFFGGEPTMHQDEICLALEQVERVSDLRQLELIMHSNLTIPFKQRLQDMFSRIGKVSIRCSLDGYGKLNDYIRSDSEFSVVESNLQQLVNLRNKLPNFRISVSYAISVYNAAGLHEFAQWWLAYDNAFRPHIVMGLLDIRNLPMQEKQRLIEYYEGLPIKNTKFEYAYDYITNLLKEPFDNDQERWQQQFKKYNDLLDQRRGTRLAEVYPELAALLI